MGIEVRPVKSNNVTLMQWSALQFRVWPLNIHEVDHQTATDWARKEIAGAPLFREWVGENDEELHLRGRVFPYASTWSVTVLVLSGSPTTRRKTLLLRPMPEFTP